ncbi:MAG: spore germination protein [Firmicutes bacterium]|nr:spore germination protein [Bacillota bacterium]
MFEWLFNAIRRTIKKRQTESQREPSLQSETREISSSLKQNKKIVKEIFDRCDDLVIHEFRLGQTGAVEAMLVFFGPMVDQEMLQKSLLHSLLKVDWIPRMAGTAWLKESVIPSGEATEKNTWLEVGNGIAKGLVALFTEGQKHVILIPIREDVKRQVSQPVMETTVRGPQAAFNEDLRTNIALLRKFLPTSRLALENFKIGELSKTEVSMVYLKGYVKTELIEEVKSRIQRIKTDAAQDSGYIEEFIQDNRWSVFAAIEPTERPDRLAGYLVEGYVGLLFDTTPFALTLPTTLASQVQSPDDYMNRYWFSSFIRLLRWGGLAFSLMLPSFYISVTTFHQELIPTPLLLSVAAARERVPFPGFMEALFMELTFEILREAGVRIPKSFGQTISIVGAIVIGQAAVSAGLVSPVMVIVVALTAIASYTIPSVTLANSVRILRFPLMMASAFMGLFGMMVGLSILAYHLCSLRSFGVPYLSPLAPLSFSDLKDTLIRAPAWKMNLRPRLVGIAEPQRQHSDLKPDPPATRVGRSPWRRGNR